MKIIAWRNIMEKTFEDVLDENLLDEGERKVKGGWINKGKHPKGKPHVFKKKSDADDQRKAMFANGFKG